MQAPACLGLGLDCPFLVRKPSATRHMPACSASEEHVDGGRSLLSLPRQHSRAFSGVPQPHQHPLPFFACFAFFVVGRRPLLASPKEKQPVAKGSGPGAESGGVSSRWGGLCPVPTAPQLSSVTRAPHPCLVQPMPVSSQSCLSAREATRMMEQYGHLLQKVPEGHTYLQPSLSS